jgi:hypothetical protein
MPKAIHVVIEVGRGGPEETEDGKEVESSTRFGRYEECQNGWCVVMVLLLLLLCWGYKTIVSILDVTVDNGDVVSYWKQLRVVVALRGEQF